MAETPSQEEVIFHRALEIDAPDQRAAYLAEACAGRQELRRRVEALLRRDAESTGPLDRPAGGLAAAPGEPVAEQPGTAIGPYKLLERIGEGGMGAVWMAEQREPVQRKVALKIVKAGMDSRQVVARFEAERQALALMDHPNIATVFDGGATAGGRPYFVMELVKGTPITRYCDEHRLTPRERLELFVPVCHAIQHAHTKGIIHRDVKPANVLVAPYDGVPVPKVIDFGVAKATGQRLTERTLFTGFGAVLGTVQYMSPEQAELNNHDIDTRSDIYSLGVLLYELLTGTTPLRHERLKQAAFAEVLRAIREDEPPKPSTRLSESKDTLPSIAAQRHMEPAKLTKLVRGELDWIVMKALEKDRGRRYETANGLARDIQHYLAEEPVQACPPSLAYRCRKFVRRHKARLAVAGLVLFFLIVLGGGVGWVLGEQRARQREADAKVLEALDEAVPLLRQGNPQDPALVAAAQRARAQRDAGLVSPGLRDQVEQLLRDWDMLARLENARLQAAAGSKEMHFDYAGAGELYAQAFQGYNLDVTSLNPEEAAAHLRTSAIHTHLVAALDDWAYVRNQLHPGAGTSLSAVAELADDDSWRQRLRRAARRTDRAALEKLAEGEGTVSQPAANHLGPLLLALAEAHSIEAAERLLRRAQAEHPADFWINFELANLLSQKKTPDWSEVVRFYQAALALRPQSPVVYYNLGNAMHEQGKLAEAVKAYHKAIKLNPKYAYAHYNLGKTLDKQGELAEAVVEFREALRLKRDYADAHASLGNALADQGKPAEAEAEYREALRLRPDFPEAHDGLGVALAGQRKQTEAEAEHREALRLRPDFPEAHYNLGLALAKQGKTGAEAESHLREALRLRPNFPEAHDLLGPVLCEQGKHAEAEAAFREALRLRPDSPHAHGGLRVALAGQGKYVEAEAQAREELRLWPDFPGNHSGLGNALKRQGKNAEAEAQYREELRLRPDYPEAHCNLGHVLIAQGRFVEGLNSLKRGHELGSKKPNWHYPSAKWVRQAEQLVATHGKKAGRSDTEPKTKQPSK